MLSPLSPQSGGSDQERTKKKRRGDRYSVQTSLIVATLKKMLPIGLNMCAPTDQELIAQAKNRYALVPAPPRDGNLPAPDPTPHQAPGPLLNPQASAPGQHKQCMGQGECGRSSLRESGSW